MLGFYNYTVIITYLSLVSAGIGMTFSTTGNFKAAICCLLFSGLCDMTDGAVARTRKRTDQEKRFGIQIDSLCDCISFGVQPAVIVYCMTIALVPGNNALRITALAVGIAFALCAVIRLAFFNVMEEERQKKEGSKRRTFYQGLPVTNISLILPITYLATYFLDGIAYAVVMIATLVIVGFLFIKDFKMFKATGKQEVIIGLCGALVIVAVILS